MGVDNRIETIPELKQLEQPWAGYHDVAATQESIQLMLAGGIPNWVKFPEDYRQFVKESFAREKEISDEMAEQYQMEDQQYLTNRKARMVNLMSTDNFVAKLRQNGIKCFTVYNGYALPSKHPLKMTIALWCIPPKQTARARYICYLQIPAMYEWSVLAVNPHNVPIGEAFRGWRTVLIQLIKKEILTEFQAHPIFGYPSENIIFRRYRQSLWEIRNLAKYTEDELAAKDV